MGARRVEVELVEGDEPPTPSRGARGPRRSGVAAAAAAVVVVAVLVVTWAVGGRAVDEPGSDPDLGPSGAGNAQGPAGTPTPESTPGAGADSSPDPGPTLDPPVDPSAPLPPEPDAARLAELAAIPGVLRPVGPGARPLAGEELAAALRFAGGVVVGGTVVVTGALRGGEPPDGAAEPVVSGLDPLTGDVRWVTDLREAGWSAPPDVEGSGWDGCLAAGDVAVCRRHDWSADPSYPPTPELWAFGAGDGAALWRRALAPSDEWLLASGRVVVAGSAAEVSVGDAVAGEVPVRRRVAALDPATGDAVWTWTSPAVTTRVSIDGDPGVPGYAHDLEAGRGQVVVVVGGHGWRLAAPDGRQVGEFEVPAAAALQPLGDGLLMTAGGSLSLLGDDGWLPVAVPGAQSLPPLPVDDGSVAGLVLVGRLPTARAAGPGAGRHGTVWALDPATGGARWEAEVPDPAGMLLLDGVLYSTNATETAAVDATDGRRHWTARPDHEVTWLATDGRALLLVGPGSTVEARGLADGRLLWRADLAPAGATLAPASVTVGALVPRLVAVTQGEQVPVG